MAGMKRGYYMEKIPLPGLSGPTAYYLDGLGEKAVDLEKPQVLSYILFQHQVCGCPRARSYSWQALKKTYEAPFRAAA